MVCHLHSLEILPPQPNGHRSFPSQKLAEGVGFEPFLPSSDQGHKGRFAPLPKQHPIFGGVTNEIPPEIRPYPSSLGLKTRREHRHSQELGTGSNQTK